MRTEAGLAVVAALLACGCEAPTIHVQPTARSAPAPSSDADTSRKPTPSVGAFVNAIADPAYKIVREAKVWVFINPKANILDRQLGGEIQRLLKECGFRVTELGEAEFVIQYQSSVTNSEFNLSVPTIVRQPGGGASTGYAQTRESHLIFTLSMIAYKADELRAENSRSVWEAKLVTGALEFNENQVTYLRHLVSQFGKNHPGRFVK